MQENEITYKKFKNKLTHIIRIAKKNYFREKCDMHRNNGKKAWETIGQILKNKNGTTTVTDTFITSNGIPCTDNTDIANNFNTYFTTVGNTLAANAIDPIVPTKLKIAKVIPLYKTKDPALFCNYRKISLLPVFLKILEWLMYNRLYNFLTEHSILSMNQLGFRKKYSTFLALMDLVDNIAKKHRRRKLQYRDFSWFIKSLWYDRPYHPIG